MCPALPAPAGIRGTNQLPLFVWTFCLLWSSAFAVAKLTLLYAPPLLLLTARFLIAGIVMMGALLVQRKWPIGRRDLLVFAALGLVNNAIYLGLNYAGMTSISAGLAAIISSSNPVLTALLAATFLHERITWRKAAGLALGVGGVAFIVESRIGGGADHPIGIVLTIGGLISLVTGTILFKRVAPNGGPWVGNAVQNLTAGIALLPLALTFEHVNDVVPSWYLFVGLAYLALLVSVFGYLLWFYLLRIYGAISASAYHFLMPPLGLMFGWMLLGERPELAELLGILPVGFSIYLVTRSGFPQLSLAGATPLPETKEHCPNQVRFTPMNRYPPR
jgi:drug/metabolite transporter (DMT)-like permease